jgi:carboxypeptidase Taq
MSITGLLAYFYDTLASLATLREIEAVLAWDEEVGMPSGAAPSRAKQRSLITGLISKKLRDPRFVEIVFELIQLKDSLSFDNRINVERIARDLTRAKKIPESLVEKRSEARSLCIAAWHRARSTRDSSLVVPRLSTVIALAREEAAYVGIGDTAYDSFLDFHEPEARESTVIPLFSRLEARLIPLLRERRKHSFPSKEHFEGAHSPLYMPISEQQFLCQVLLSTIGFDHSISRMSSSSHPFHKTLSVSDHRITVRYDPDNFLRAVLISLHEYGHYLYGSRLPVQHYGTPRGRATSVGVDESQSRFWENMVGRSRPFSEFLFSLLQEHLPEYAINLCPDFIWNASNIVDPSHIRLDASEVSYPLHVILRTDIESRLINKTLEVSEVRDFWCSEMERLLDVRPHGCMEGWLQDMHWFIGLFGYFPTYILGTLIAAEFTEALRQERHSHGEDWSDEVRRGYFAPTINWLNSQVWCHGQTFFTKELVEKVTRKSLSEDAFMQHLHNKFRFFTLDS